MVKSKGKLRERCGSGSHTSTSPLCLCVSVLKIPPETRKPMDNAGLKALCSSVNVPFLFRESFSLNQRLSWDPTSQGRGRDDERALAPV